MHTLYVKRKSLTCGLKIIKGNRPRVKSRGTVASINCDDVGVKRLRLSVLNSLRFCAVEARNLSTYCHRESEYDSHTECTRTLA